MAKAGVSGVGLAVAAVGGVLIYSGIQNQTLLVAARSLAKGQAIPAGVQKSTPVASGAAASGASGGAGAAGGLVGIAASMKGHAYLLGGGHGSFCPSGGMDCSGYVSCVLNKAGLLSGHPLTTDGLAKWGVAVTYAQRQPGDVLVWIGGPAGGHCGIAASGSTMWHNPCTACGGVQLGSYGSTRTGRQTIVRRARG
jgi:cell wall-associated NlpC family hydrolase